MTSVEDELAMVALQVEETPEIVLPLSGEFIDLRKPPEVARALDSVRTLVTQLGEVSRLLETVLRLEGQRVGAKTLHLPPYKATISGGEKNEWDIELLRDGLREAGLPEDRLSAAVIEEITYKVSNTVIRQLASANRAYAEVIDQARTRVPANWYVRVERE